MLTRNIYKHLYRLLLRAGEAISLLSAYFWELNIIINKHFILYPNNIKNTYNHTRS